MYVEQREQSVILEIDRLTMRFRDVTVLRDISVQLRRGETLAVIGESGCGKTVLLKTLIGLLWPTSGRIVFDGRPLADLSEGELSQQRTRYGFVFQQAALFDSMSIAENVAFPLRQHTNRSEDEIMDMVIRLLAEVGLPEMVLHKKPAELSGGMRKRVGFARALAMEPELMLYDEPTTGLDPIMSDVINELIVNTRKRYNVSGIIVTHDMKSAKKVADRIVMLYPVARLRPDEPQIVYEGPADEIDLSPDNRVTQFIHGQAGERLMEMCRTHQLPYAEVE
ncbi:MAG: ATP-binding cassette domain-containing protein [Planctomycetaceae bacterium]|nr:ATP-binding cassette domain-containing protein [Planctomycetaceae bacterium]